MLLGIVYRLLDLLVVLRNLGVGHAIDNLLSDVHRYPGNAQSDYHDDYEADVARDDKPAVISRVLLEEKFYLIFHHRFSYFLSPP
jgi:hypothetical protein